MAVLFVSSSAPPTPWIMREIEQIGAVELRLAQSGQQRAERKDKEAGVIEILAAEHVGQAPDDRHEARS